MASPDIPASKASFKYFYTDPVAAAWMVKHFGMRFISPFGPDAHCGFGTFTYFEITGTSGRFFLAQDSLHQLEPQVGDLYFSTEDQIAFPLSDELCQNWNVRPEGAIIQRNGKAFHWPERGAANGS